MEDTLELEAKGVTRQGYFYYDKCFMIDILLAHLNTFSSEEINKHNEMMMS